MNMLNTRQFLRLLPVLVMLTASEFGVCQDSSKPLLRLQESRAFLNIDSNARHGQEMVKHSLPHTAPPDGVWG